MNESLKKSLPPPRAILNQLYPKLAELRLPPKPCRPFHSPSLSEQLPPAGHFQQRLWLIFFQAAGSDSQFLLCVLHGRSLPLRAGGSADRAVAGRLSVASAWHEARGKED